MRNGPIDRLRIERRKGIPKGTVAGMRICGNAGSDARVNSPWSTARLAPAVAHRSLDNSMAPQAKLVRGGKRIRGQPSGSEHQGGVILNSTGYKEKSNVYYYLYLIDRPVASRRQKNRLLQKARFDLIQALRWS